MFQQEVVLCQLDWCICIWSVQFVFFFSKYNTNTAFGDNYKYTLWATYPIVNVCTCTTQTEGIYIFEKINTCCD